ncbi:hypothetical protein AAG906_005485 [Vitis piasezkii]
MSAPTWIRLVSKPVGGRPSLLHEAGVGRINLEASKVEVPKPQGFSGKRDAKELDNCLWHMERYFEAITLTDEAAKRRDFSKVESLEDSHATGGGDGVSRDHNTPRMGSGKMPNVREGRCAQCHDRGEGIGRQQKATLQASKMQVFAFTRGLTGERGKLGTCRCLEKVLETHLEVSRKGHNGDVDGIGGEECHKMLQITLPMDLYRRWEASRDLWRHLHLATKWKSMEASREGQRCPHISTLG